MLTRSFTESTADFLNPERGYYVGFDLLAPGDMNRVRNGGNTLALAQVSLAAYRDRALDSSLLTALDAGFDAVRAAGIKVIVRFKYSSSAGEPDAPKARILQHIEQLTPLLNDNQDVISALQAGFIGAWGEWHGSANGLDNDNDRTDILNALLDALPASRFVQVRAPMFKAAAFGAGRTEDAEAFGGSRRARVGHHNDCFLASASDYGTYADPVDEWMAYVADDTRYTPMGGETCAVYEPRTNCTAALQAMANHHWTYLNQEYNVSVLNQWANGGCDQEVRRRLGYRLVAEQLGHNESVAPGGVLSMQLSIANRGFAAPFNERPVYVVLSGEGVRHLARLSRTDVRRWTPGQSTMLVSHLRLPADLPPGRYTVSLWLPDADATLRSDPRYAIRLANDDIWDGATGENVLIEDLLVDPGAPGAVDPSAGSFTEL